MGRPTLYYYAALICIACAGIPKGESSCKYMHLENREN